MKSIIDDGFHHMLVEGACFEKRYDIPIIYPIPETVPLPKSLVRFDQRYQTKNYHQWIHYYMFDKRFRTIITNTERHITTIQRFDGSLTPDCSLYRDMPYITQVANTYLNRAVGHYMQRMGIPVITNIRWSDDRSFDFAFLGAPQNSTLAVSNHGCLSGKENRYWFERGFDEMVCRLEPRRVIMHGRTIEALNNRYPNIQIAVYPSRLVQSREEVR